MDGWTIRRETRRNKKKEFRRGAIAAVLICTLGTGALGIGVGIGVPWIKNLLHPSITIENSGNNTNVSSDTAVKSAPSSGADNSAEVQPIVISTAADIIKLISPTVVSIQAVTNASANFFSISGDNTGSGSGIIFSQNSDNIYIATNYHVVSGASSVSVKIEDSSNIQATFVGSNPESDLAVISLSKAAIESAGVKSVTVAVFGDSEKMQVGDPVITIGNAIGEGNVVTSGIVSANDKEVTIDGNTLTVIQTDAAINPGNSGGPLINIFGEVIGINTAKLSGSAIEGMGYSITSNAARPILDDMMRQTPRPFLGIQGTDMTADMASIYNMPGRGVFVQDVVPGSGAQKAGIQRTDVITGFNGEAIFTMKQLSDAVLQCKAGDEVTVKVYRNGDSQMEFQVKLTAYKTDNF